MRVDVPADAEHLNQSDRDLLLLWATERVPKRMVTATTLADLYAVVGRIKADALLQR